MSSAGGPQAAAPTGMKAALVSQLNPKLYTFSQPVFLAAVIVCAVVPIIIAMVAIETQNCQTTCGLQPLAKLSEYDSCSPITETASLSEQGFTEVDSYIAGAEAPHFRLRLVPRSLDGKFGKSSSLASFVAFLPTSAAETAGIALQHTKRAEFDPTEQVVRDEWVVTYRPSGKRTVDLDSIDVRGTNNRPANAEGYEYEFVSTVGARGAVEVGAGSTYRVVFENVRRVSDLRDFITMQSFMEEHTASSARFGRFVKVCEAKSREHPEEETCVKFEVDDVLNSVHRSAGDGGAWEWLFGYIVDEQNINAFTRQDTDPCSPYLDCPDCDYGDYDRGDDAPPHPPDNGMTDYREFRNALDPDAGQLAETMMYPVPWFFQKWWLTLGGEAIENAEHYDYVDDRDGGYEQFRSDEMSGGHTFFEDAIADHVLACDREALSAMQPVVAAADEATRVLMVFDQLRDGVYKTIGSQKFKELLDGLEWSRSAYCCQKICPTTFTAVGTASGYFAYVEMGVTFVVLTGFVLAKGRAAYAGGSAGRSGALGMAMVKQVWKVASEAEDDGKAKSEDPEAGRGAPPGVMSDNPLRVGDGSATTSAKTQH